MRKPFFVILLILFTCLNLYSTPYNIATKARVAVSSTADIDHGALCLTDGLIRHIEKGEWRSASKVTFWGEIDFPWIQLTWDSAVYINKIVIYDRPDNSSNTAGGTLHFSDGSRESVLAIPANGAPCVIEFTPRLIYWVRFEITDGEGENIGLSEIEVYPSPDSYTDLVSFVDPYIETTRGRYFFFITGNQPYGMISAAPLTRNKNQGGGGYNYNSNEVLGFPQLHCWMISGLSMMPVDIATNPTLGEDGWKSEFSHNGEEVQPGYHRLYLERYNVWVEQTATDRASLYRFTYTNDTVASILLNLGGYVGTTTMINAHADTIGNNTIIGHFDTTGRLWGGHEKVRVFFAAQFDRPMANTTTWIGDTIFPNTSRLCANTTAIARNEGMSYSDAPTAGIVAHFTTSAETPLHLRMAISYVSTDNALDNLKSSDTDDFDFDRVREKSQKEWNEWLGRIMVKGGTDTQRIKFYTDLWHVLLGRHKIDDNCGEYPDYTQGGTRDGKYTRSATMKVRRLPRSRNGEVCHHMYNSDALWLTQWNLNSLWGIAYPDVLDDFAASLIQYSINGGLLPRGPNIGGYSYIMSGCPATSLITSAYQRGIHNKWSPKRAYKEIKRNHMAGGILAIDQNKELLFYEQHGYCPEKAGLTIQWSFEDWALSEMALKMGKKKDAEYFKNRASGWTRSFHPQLKLVLPRKANGEWLHTNPLDGNGYEEANAWQATFGLSHDLPRLATLMGGTDSLCSMLNHAFVQSVTTDFVTGYGSGYVSYANQPGLSNAHVFTHAGRPDLTQYWVRRVKEQAYGGTTPDKGYGGHDEDQGQMGALSALMAIGLFSIDGGCSSNASYDITSPVFDEIVIKLHPEYCKGKYFHIVTHNNTPHNCYIQSMVLNGKEYNEWHIKHNTLTDGGRLDIYLHNR